MRTDNILRADAIKVLLTNLGKVDTELFISMIKRDTFDYTEWRRDLFRENPLKKSTRWQPNMSEVRIAAVNNINA